MSVRHIKELVAAVKRGERPSGWLADMALLEIVAIEEALGVLMTELGARVDAKTYGRAKALLEQVARGS